MPCKIGNGERVARLLLGSLLAAVGLWEVGGLLHGAVATVVGAVGLALVVTGTLGCSPGRAFRHVMKARGAVGRADGHGCGDHACGH